VKIKFIVLRTVLRHNKNFTAQN